MGLREETSLSGTRHFLGALPFLAILLLPAAPADAASAKSVPSSDRKALERVLTNAFRALPTPSKGFREDRPSGSREIVAGVGTGTGTAAAKAPAKARQVRVYERLVGTGDEEETVSLEIQVYVNQERTLPEPLASEGGTPETFLHEGLPGMRVSLAGVASGRVALPLTTEEERTALTVVRLYVGAPDVDSYLVEIAQDRRPDRTPWDSRPVKKTSEVRTIVVEFRGPRDEVGRLTKATPAAPLRALITP